MTDGTGNTLYGYFSRFNEPTEIDSWEGRFIERVKPGAFTRTLKERDGQIRLLFDHGRDPSIGRKPLGKPMLREDASGGLYEVELLQVPALDHIREAAAQSLLGSSFQFAAVSEMWRQPTRPTPENPKCLPERDLIDLDLFELGPVVFPAYQNTNPSVRDRAATDEARQAARKKYARLIVARRSAVRAVTPTKPRPGTASPAARSRSLQAQANAVVLGRRNCRTAAELERSLKRERELIRGAQLLLTARRAVDITPVVAFRAGGSAMVR